MQLKIEQSLVLRGKNSDRWKIALAGATVMLTTGTIYSWAIFTQPLVVAFNWDVTTPTWAFAIANFFLAAVGAIVGGFWQDVAGPRPVALAGVSLWAMGNVLTGLGTSAYGAPWLYVSYGVIGGFGAGMAYITPLAMVTKWFPDRQGLAGGLVAGGFGLGAFLYNQLVARLPSFHAASVHAGGFIAARAAAKAARLPFRIDALSTEQILTSADLAAVMHVFVGSGVAFLIIGLGAASVFRNPPVDRKRFLESGYSPSQLFATHQFYLLWLQLFINVITGITIISNAVFILADLTKVSAAAIAPLFGLISIFNAVGRFFWGGLSDRVGCNRTFAAMFTVQAVTLFFLSGAHDLPLALAGFALILLCCGGGFGTMPAFNAQYFGTKHMGLNYALILSAWGFAGLVGPTVVAHVKDLSGSFIGLLPTTAVLLAAAVVLPFITKRPAPAASAHVILKDIPCHAGALP